MCYLNTCLFYNLSFLPFITVNDFFQYTQYLIGYPNLNNTSTFLIRASKQTKIKETRARTEKFNYSYFLFYINYWNKLYNSIKKQKTWSKLIIMKFFILKKRSLFSIINDAAGVKLLMGLLLNFCYINQQKFCFNFKDTKVWLELKLKQHFFLH